MPRLECSDSWTVSRQPVTMIHRRLVASRRWFRRTLASGLARCEKISTCGLRGLQSYLFRSVCSVRQTPRTLDRPRFTSLPTALPLRPSAIRR